MAEKLESTVFGDESLAWLDSMPFGDEERWDHYKELGLAVEAGKSIWVIRNPEAEGGQVFDFFKGGALRGFVDHDGPDFVVYLPGTDAEGPLAVFVGKSFDQARQALESSLV